MLVPFPSSPVRLNPQDLTVLSVQMACEWFPPPAIVCPKACAEKNRSIYRSVFFTHQSYNQNPKQPKAGLSCRHVSTTCHRLTITCYQLTLTCYQLAITCHRLSVTCHRLTITCHQLTITCHQLSVTCHQLNLVFPKTTPFIGKTRIIFTHSADELMFFIGENTQLS